MPHLQALLIPWQVQMARFHHTTPTAKRISAIHPITSLIQVNLNAGKEKSYFSKPLKQRKKSTEAIQR